MTEPYPYELATPDQRKIGSWWLCIHHAVRLERLSEPVENRVRAIRETKPMHEVETRLRALRPFVGEIPAAVDKAQTDYEKAWDDLVEALESPEVIALFGKQCPDVKWGQAGLVFPVEARP